MNVVGGMTGACFYPSNWLFSPTRVDCMDSRRMSCSQTRTLGEPSPQTSWAKPELTETELSCLLCIFLSFLFFWGGGGVCSGGWFGRRFLWLQPMGASDATHLFLGCKRSDPLYKPSNGSEWVALQGSPQGETTPPPQAHHQEGTLR